MAAVVCWCLFLLSACSQSAEEQERADARRIQAERIAIVERQTDEAIDQARARCSESGEEFRRLLREHNGYFSDSLLRNLPRSLEFVRGIQAASAHHDPSKPCAGIIDSVARAQGLVR